MSVADLITIVFLGGFIGLFGLVVVYLIVWLRSGWIGGKKDKLEMRKLELEIEKLEKERVQ